MTTPVPVPARRARGYSLRHVLASLVFFTLSGVSPLGAHRPTGAIAGRVFNASSGAALRNVVVTIEGSGQEVTTADEGHYLLPGVMRVPIARLPGMAKRRPKPATLTCASVNLVVTPLHLQA